MSVETALTARADAHAGLHALIAGRFYADLAPQSGLSQPYIVFSLVDTVIQQAMGSAVIPVKSRYQFDLYADTKPNLITLYTEFMNAFHRWMSDPNGTVVDALFETAQDTKEAVVMVGSATQLRHRSVDLMVIYNP